MYAFISYLSWLSALLPVIAWARNLPCKTPRLILLVVLLKTISFLTDSVCLFLLNRSQPLNLHLINIYDCLEFLLLLAVYITLWKSGKMKTFLSLLALCWTVFIVLSLIFSWAAVWQHLKFASALIIVPLSISTLHQQLLQNTKTNLAADPAFWINASFLVYFFGNLLIFVSERFILSSSASVLMKNLWIVHNIINVLGNLLIVKGIITWRKNRSYSISLPVY